MVSITPSPKKRRTKKSIVTSDSLNSTSRKLPYTHLHSPLAEGFYEMPNESLEMLVKQRSITFMV